MYRVTTGDPLIGKRVNLPNGGLGTVIAIDYYPPNTIGVVVIKYDNYEMHSVVIRRVIEAMPEVVSRASFTYKPGDRA
jgi:hypothetical protein